jgi:hypothetical protein
VPEVKEIVGNLENRKLRQVKYGLIKQKIFNQWKIITTRLPLAAFYAFVKFYVERKLKNLVVQKFATGAKIRQ